MLPKSVFLLDHPLRGQSCRGVNNSQTLRSGRLVVGSFYNIIDAFKELLRIAIVKRTNNTESLKKAKASSLSMLVIWVLRYWMAKPALTQACNLENLENPQIGRAHV